MPGLSDLTRLAPGCPYRLWGRANQDEIIVRESWELNVYRLTPELCKGARGTVVDCGAHIGALTSYASHLGAQRVISIEPGSENRAILERNIAENLLPATVMPCAVGRSRGEVELLPFGSWGHIKGLPHEYVAKDTDPVERVPMVTLADVFAEHEIDLCDVLKIDIEGSEYGLIEAAPVELLARVHYICMEAHPTDAETFGRLIWKLERTHCVHMLGEPPGSLTNIYATRAP